MILSGFKTVELNRLECESFQDYLERIYFVINNLKFGKYDFENLVEKSLLFYSVKVLKCKYDISTMDELQNMCKYAGVRFEK